MVVVVVVREAMAIAAASCRAPVVSDVVVGGGNGDGGDNSGGDGNDSNDCDTGGNG